ncbi:MAG: hypothetical protein CL570_00060 [Alphaproteobacteria bacterium]|nr:hypothetical protein [Alphaproteobacteria bacterium]
MVPFIEQAQLYGRYHTKRITWYTHMAGIPLLFLSAFMLLGFIHIVIPNVLDIRIAEIVAIALLVYYFRLEWRLAFVVTPIFIVLLYISSLFTYAGPSAFSLWATLIFFLLGCVLQLIGHILEGKRPAFTHNLWHSLISPLFLTAEVFFMMGWMPKLERSIQNDKNDDTKESEEQEIID